MRKLLSNDSGVAVIELAMVAPVFALMTIGIVDISNAYSAKLALEQGAQRAIEKIMQTTQDLPVNDTLKKEAMCQVNGYETDEETGTETCNAGLVALDNITVTDRLECVAVDGTMVVKTGDAASDDCADDEEERRYKSVRVTAVYDPMFPLRFTGYDSAATGYPISAEAGMRTQ